MPTLNNKLTPYHYIIFFLWLLLTLVAAIYFVNSRLTLFDPTMRLNGLDNTFIIKSIREIEEIKNVNISNTIIHFTSNNCACTKLSEAHKVSIDKKAKESNFNILKINLASNLSNIIPSTPAVLILNEKEDLLYFGPYSNGVACSESNSYVETVLQNYAKGYSANLVISEVSGCYCHR